MTRKEIKRIVQSIVEPPVVDFTLSDSGTIYLMRPHTEDAREWLADHIGTEAQYLGQNLVVEHRYIDHIVEGARRDGLVVQ